MKKTFVLSISIIGGILLTILLVSTISTMASAHQASAPASIFFDLPQPMDFSEIPADGFEVQEESFEYAVLDVSGVSRFMPTSIYTLGTPRPFTQEGIRAPGEIVTYTITQSPVSTDTEGIDAFMFFAPAGWEILQISTAPSATNDDSYCFHSKPVPDVTQSFTNPVTGHSIAYWGNVALEGYDPISSTQRSECGPWMADGTTYTFWVRLKVDPDAETCPGAPLRVGVPWDPLDPASGEHEFKWSPQIEKSLTFYLYGDGSGGTPTNKSTMTWERQLQQACPIPVIQLEKTVTTGSCPGTKDNIDVVSGTQVTYCFQMFNLNPLVTVTNHTLVDDQLGTFTYTQSVPGGSMWSTGLAQTVIGTVSTTISNEATWTATTLPGFGQLPQDDWLSTFETTTYSDTAVDTASVHIIKRPGKVYLPLVLNSYLVPEAGFWQGAAEDFYVTPDNAFVDDFAVHINVPGCGNIKLWLDTPVPIQGDSFSFSAASGAWTVEGKFVSPTTAQGKSAITNYNFGPCGNVTIPEWIWAATWQNTSQPSVLDAELSGAVVGVLDE
jgi:hypothetical protein